MATKVRQAPPLSAHASERLVYALRCTLAACLAYALGKQTWPQLPLWAPVSALAVSHQSWRQTAAFVSGQSAGCMVGLAIAGFVAVLGHEAVPEIAQVGIAVALAAALSFNWSSARSAMWMALIGVWLIDRVPGQLSVSSGMRMVVQVLAGAAIGGMVACVFEMFARPAGSTPPAPGVGR